jgi:hypothetical protein
MDEQENDSKKAKHGLMLSDIIEQEKYSLRESQSDGN